MSDTEKQVYNYYQTALEKFDYFILGIVIVVSAFLSKEIDFQPVGSNLATIQLFSLLLFGVAGFSSFKRSENQISQYKFNYISLVSKRKRDAEMFDILEDKIQETMKTSHVYYQIRNTCFLMGFAVYIFSKVFGAYIGS
jgi:hypothetical protein